MQNKIWLSYAQMKTAQEPLKISHTKGAYIYLQDGSKMIDGISSWWTACHGHCNDYIIHKITEQLNIAPHLMLTGLIHEPIEKLYNKLGNILPEHKHYIFSESGSVAVEIALKIALQYFSNQKIYKSKFIYFENGYHGDTIGTSAVTDDDTYIHQFIQSKDISIKCKVPQNQQDLVEFEQIIANNQKDLAGLIIEPMLQCAGGMKIQDPEILKSIYNITKKYGLLFIADEIATGFYRTGKFFGCNHADITPDIICLGKAITSGTIPFAATGVTDEIYNAFYSDNFSDALKHATTFAGYPLGCAAATASIELFEKEPRELQVKSIEAQLIDGLKPLLNMNNIIDVRVIGAMAAIELNCSPDDIQKMRGYILETKDVWLRPFRNIIYTMPPFICNENEINIIIDKIRSIYKNIINN